MTAASRHSAEPLRIGIDLDNTLACYDAVFARAAAAAGHVASADGLSKQDVRAKLRGLPDGERHWMALQGQVYGKLMGEADLIEGAAAFLNWCRDTGAAVKIVSHKTEFGHMDPDRVNLRDAARGWLAAKGFFDPDGFALSPDDVHFESTREEKVGRIAEFDFDVFIDDLWEVFDEDGFPDQTRQVLLERHGHDVPISSCLVCRHWDDVRRAVAEWAEAA